MSNKFNPFEVLTLKDSVELYRKGLIEEIKSTPQGKSHIFTEDYANMICDDMIEKIMDNRDKRLWTKHLKHSNV